MGRNGFANGPQPIDATSALSSTNNTSVKRRKPCARHWLTKIFRSQRLGCFVRWVAKSPRLGRCNDGFSRGRLPLQRCSVPGAWVTS